MAKVLIFATMFVLAVGLSLLFGFPIMWLWNWILVPMGLPALTFWKAVGVSLLIKLLFPHASSDSK